jgi:hypothetical protein
MNAHLLLQRPQQPQEQEQESHQPYPLKSIMEGAAPPVGNNNHHHHNITSPLHSWCQQGMSPEGLREFRISMEGMTVALAQQLTTQLTQSNLFAKMGVYGSAPPPHHDTVMRMLYDCIAQSNSIHCLSLSSPMGDAHAFAQPSTLSSLTSLILASETMTLDMARYVQRGLSNNTSLLEFTMEFGPTLESKLIFDTILESFVLREAPLQKLCVVHEESLDVTEEEDEDDDSEDREGLLGCVRQLIQVHKCPKELEFIGCDVVPKDMKVLATYLQDPSCRLEALAMNDCVNKLTHVSTLAQALSYNTSLTRLHLDCNQLDDTDLHDLARGLRHNTTLHTLHVCGNRIADEGVMNFCQEWHPMSGLQHLDIGFNMFGPRGVRQLMRTIAAQHPGMQSLALIQNDNLNYEGIQYIGEELPHVSLKTLQVSCVVNEDIIQDDEDDADANGDQEGAANHNNNITVNSIRAETKRVQQEARHRAEQALLLGIQSNVTLHDLDVSYNKLASTVESEIRFYVELNQRGRRFLSNFFQLPPALLGHLLHKCGDEPQYMYYLIREQPLLVTRIMSHQQQQQAEENHAVPLSKKRRMS